MPPGLQKEPSARQMTGVRLARAKAHRRGGHPPRSRQSPQRFRLCITGPSRGRGAGGSPSTHFQQPHCSRLRSGCICPKDLWSVTVATGAAAAAGAGASGVRSGAAGHTQCPFLTPPPPPRRGLSTPAASPPWGLCGPSSKSPLHPEWAGETVHVRFSSGISLSYPTGSNV